MSIKVGDKAYAWDPITNDFIRNGDYEILGDVVDVYADEVWIKPITHEANALGVHVDRVHLVGDGPILKKLDQIGNIHDRRRSSMIFRELETAIKRQSQLPEDVKLIYDRQEMTEDELANALLGVYELSRMRYDQLMALLEMYKKEKEIELDGRLR